MSCNLILAFQHPKVICTNLAKEIQLGRIVGPFPSSPLSNFQCHPIGVVPKKPSAEWQTIYHLSYPEGDSVNDHITKGHLWLRLTLNWNSASYLSICMTGISRVSTGCHSTMKTFISHLGFAVPLTLNKHLEHLYVVVQF